ncbi:glycosyltransferase [Sinomicrobium weinanense]|uniref:Glycosyltransferase family 2 protein n=1 Tax=Sinomicrobium weinanense TaxID=2842200 RepID=A0A926JQD7_9FLAO|nr:glycosyltransferase family 2 protein [Sinomicrobium weinanense]MBU3124578.1 glycosyltransferase family 2 protein [Sinomicrobium weinanense]
MNYYIIIPAHNEAQFIGRTLNSVAEQTLLPRKLVVVNDNSTDNTSQIAAEFIAKHSWAEMITNTDTPAEHLPGGKVVRAFYKGLEIVDKDYDFIVKMDADIILPRNYFETLAAIFHQDNSTGIAGGLVHIQQGDHWAYEAIADKTHVRGPVKAYSKNCFEKIGGLKPAIGWDTVDTLLAKYHGFKVHTDHNLKIKHLRPTGGSYTKKARLLQGQAMYTMRYGFLITFIASAKTAWRQKKWSVLKDNLRGYFSARKRRIPFLTTEEEGNFIRKYRWRGILKKIGV